MPAKLVIQDLTHYYPDEYTGESVHALEKINLKVEEGELVTVVGPSGCGKSTLLNILAGLLPYREGLVTVDGVKIEGPGSDRGVVGPNSVHTGAWAILRAETADSRVKYRF